MANLSRHSKAGRFIAPAHASKASRFPMSSQELEQSSRLCRSQALESVVVAVIGGLLAALAITQVSHPSIRTMLIIGGVGTLLIGVTLAFGQWLSPRFFLEPEVAAKAAFLWRMPAEAWSQFAQYEADESAKRRSLAIRVLAISGGVVLIPVSIVELWRGEFGITAGFLIPALVLFKLMTRFVAQTHELRRHLPLEIAFTRDGVFIHAEKHPLTGICRLEKIEHVPGNVALLRFHVIDTTEEVGGSYVGVEVPVPPGYESQVPQILAFYEEQGESPAA